MTYLFSYIILLIFSRLFVRMSILLFYHEKQNVLEKLKQVKDEDGTAFFKQTFFILYNYLFFKKDKEFVIKKHIKYKIEIDFSLKVINIASYLVPIFILFLTYKFNVLLGV